MLKLTKTGIGLLTRQYRSVLKKCLLINLGVFAATAILASITPEVVYAARDGNNTERWENGSFYIEIRPMNATIDLFANGFLSSLDENNLKLTSGGVERANYSWDGLSFLNSSGIIKTLLTETQFQLNGSTTVTGIDTAVAANANKLITSGAVKTFVEGKGYLTSSSLSGYATKATTLSGYGITDAYTKTQVDNLISQAGGSSVDLSNYYTKSDTYSRTEINNIQSLNNYYRKNEKSGILNGFEEGEKGNENDDNFSKFRADNDNFVAKNGDFASKNPSRLGAFAKCEKACPRPSERFPASLEKNSAFEQYSRSARGTFLFGFQPNKNVLDSFSKLAANDNFHLVNDGIFSNQSTTFDAKVAENMPAAELRFNIANETGKEFAKMPFCAPTVAGTSIFFRQKNIEVLDSFSQTVANINVVNDNFTVVTNTVVA